MKKQLPTLKSVSEPVIDPLRIRALMTGIGQTQQRSARTGAMRAECVRDAMPPGVADKASGYPARDPMMASVCRSDLDAPLDYRKKV